MHPRIENDSGGIIIHPAIFFVMLFMCIVGFGLPDVFRPTTYRLVVYTVNNEDHPDFDYEDEASPLYIDNNGNPTDEETREALALKIHRWWGLDSKTYELLDYNAYSIRYMTADGDKVLSVYKNKSLERIFINANEYEYYRDYEYDPY
jgi:hypothetical protein